jgi:hypothetical protein
MAKQLQRNYIFTPGGAGAGTVQIPGKYDLNQLLIITNVTKNQIIYNFADLTFVGTSVSFSRNSITQWPQVLQMADGVTTITLGISTAAMSSTDVLQIFTENPQGAVITRPWAMGTDAFERTRTANPQSMLDADFEYGMQPTKWQTISQARGYPGIYEVPGTDLSINGMITDASYASGNSASVESYITVYCNYSHALTTGSAITVNALQQNVASYDRAQGSFIVDTVFSATSFAYYAKGAVGITSGTTISQQETVVRKGGFYTGSSLTNVTFTLTNVSASTTATVIVNSTDAHGFAPGNSIMVIISNQSQGTNLGFCQGPVYITAVNSSTQFQYQARNSGNIVGTPIGYIYARSDSYYYHRPFDGGVQLGTGGSSLGTDAVRQSKKYLRYQSGKGVNYNTGALFAPNYNVRTVTATSTSSNATITLVTDDNDHGCQPGAVVSLVNAGATFNGTYTVTTIIDERTLQFTATQVLSTTTPALGNPTQISVKNWYGSTVRAGTFDDQNGIFWQYDGLQLAIGQRTSTVNLAGLVSVTIGTHLITGLNTRFTSQLIAGDRVVLKGLTHIVTSVVNDTTMYVNPEWRGAINSNSAKMVKIIDKLVTQNQWNMDRCDGSNGIYNPSGYNMDVTKMQMIALQWTWYGAGFIDWMTRGPDGNYITVHRIKNSNVNTEAYQRTGNMPVRYQVINEGAHTTLTNAVGATDSVMYLGDTTFLPSTGYLYIDQEVVQYNGFGTTSSSVINVTRGTSFNQFVAGTTRTFTGTNAVSHTAGTGALLIGQTAAPQLSHWGSAYLSDGGFDNDQGYLFNYVASNVLIGPVPTTAFAVRLAPSVSNAIVGDLGVRDLINRAQMKIQSLEITAGGTTNTNCAIVVNGVLNPQNYPTSNLITWQSLGSNGLQSGQPSFAQIAQGPSITFDNTNTVVVSTSGIAQANTNQLTFGSLPNSVQVGDTVYWPANNLAISGGTVITYINGNTVTLSNYLNQQVGNSTSITITRTGYAQPGETVFSFVSSPAERDVLDLSLLKEMTNTPLGARNCYPNGPDVLFINVYLTTGNPVYCNLTLRWGEPQA